MNRNKTRALMPDLLRVVALFGIVIVNVQFMAFPTAGGPAGFIAATGIDGIFIWLIAGLALVKTYGLFSFMFGVGLGFQMQAAARRGIDFSRSYRNRMAGLLLFGMAHGFLFFSGDILVIYAITGSVLYFWRDWQPRKLVITGTILLTLQIIITAPLAGFDASTPYYMDLERTTMTAGSLLEVIAFRSAEFLFAIPVFLVIQGISALGWFCLGLAAVKSGMIDNPRHRLWEKARRYCLVPGIILGLASAAIFLMGNAILGAALIFITAPIATLGYLGLIALLSRLADSRIANIMQPVGASSLTIYLGQSIILSTIFAPYGLGLWDEIGRAGATLIAIAVTILLMVIMALWRQVFAFGPFEWLLRKITHAGIR